MKILKQIFKTRAIIVLILFFSFCLDASGQIESTGFYVVLDKKKGCANPFKSLTQGEPLCLSKNPILSKVDFEYMSNVQVDSIQRTKYINLKMTKEAYTKFQLLGKKLPKTTLALVIDGTIVGIIENLPGIGNPIPIFSTLYSSDIEWVYDKLKKLNITEKP